MKHSIAFGTGATYGLGHAAGRLFATEGYREVIVTGAPWPGCRRHPLNSQLKPKDRCSRRQSWSARSARRFPPAQCRDGPR